MGSVRLHGFLKYFLGLIIYLIAAGTFSVFAQEIRVIRTEGPVAVINAGSNIGFREGGQVRVVRMKNGMWKEISRATITKVTPDMARIEVVEGAPMVTFKPGDIVVKISLNSNSKINIQAASDNSYQTDSSNPSAEFQRPRGAYVGPTVDMLLPQGDMKECFDNRVGYGAMVGFRFQSSFDVSIRFMFAARSNEWSFWNLQLLGRVYDASNLFADFGYGICYPSIADRFLASFGNIQTVRMGFVLGAGYPFPVSSNKQFEVGVLYHYYPNFGKNAGQFFSIHGRLIIKSSVQ